MSAVTHTRARTWAADALGAVDVGAGATYHLRDGAGRRVRVAGRHIEARAPNFFPVGPTLSSDPFDDLVVVLFETDWSVVYAYRLPFEAVAEHTRKPGRQGYRLMIKGDDSWRRGPRVQALV